MAPPEDGQSGARTRVLIVGAAGAVGTALAREILRRRGPKSVIAVLRKTPLPPDLAEGCVQELGVDIRDPRSLGRVFERHGRSIDAVWNLAAPLSVETAANPAVAEAVTVGGMRTLLACCAEHGVKKICFSDSIGSYGLSSPRDGATAAWLVRHPDHDPGSEYGRLKRRCRELLERFARVVPGGDTRWAVIPGVLHADPSWGDGTTEYALDAMLAAAEGRPLVIKVPMDARLPMIHRDDLVRGLVALMDAPRERLGEPGGGYAMAGFSFTAAELVRELRKRYPRLTVAPQPAGGPAGTAAELAVAWPDSLSGEAARRDLGFAAAETLQSTVAQVCAAHEKRLAGGGRSRL